MQVYPNQGQPQYQQVPQQSGFFTQIGGQMMAAAPMVFHQDVLSYLNTYPAIYINQKFDLLEALCAIEMPNAYHVWAGDQQGNQYGVKPLFKVKEKSSCCARIFLGPYRPYELRCHSYVGGVTKKNNIYKDDKYLVMNMARPFRCTYLCFQRPFLDIFVTEGGANNFLGKIVCPFYCNPCKLGIEIFDSTNLLKYYVEASKCQAIFCVALPCKSCQTAKFIVYDKDHNELQELWKESQGCMKACLGGQGDSFRVLFPKSATKEDKALLMAAAIFLDYSYFENPSKDGMQQDSV